MPPVLPTRFIAGDTLSLSASLSAYPASEGWVLKLRLVPRGAGTAIDATGTADGDAHALTVAAATTATWLAATYSATAYVELGSVVHTVESATLEIVANPRTTASGLDNRTASQIGLDNVRATLQGTALANVLRYTIQGRSLDHYSIEELKSLEAYFVAAVAREQAESDIQAGRPSRRKIYGRVGRA